MNNALEVRSICKHYKGSQVKDVSFSIPLNSITGLIGINGAGKTTTIKPYFIAITQFDDIN